MIMDKEKIVYRLSLIIYNLLYFFKEFFYFFHKRLPEG